MIIQRGTQTELLKMEIINNLSCDDCREKIDTFDFYTMIFAPNKNNGKYVLLCGDCARKLQNELNLKIREF